LSEKLSERIRKALLVWDAYGHLKQISDEDENLVKEIEALETKVKQLYENNDSLQESYKNIVIEKHFMEKRLMKAQELVEKWRKEMPSPFFPSRDGLICADELEEALK
jgi:chromosome segregation ATPase